MYQQLNRNPHQTRIPLRSKATTMIASLTALLVFASLHLPTAEAQLYGNLVIVGPTSAKVKGTIGSFKMASVDNDGDPSLISGTIELAMWVTKRRYRGGTISGSKLLLCRYDGIPGGYQYKKINCRGRISKPRRGSYYVTITAAEYDGVTGDFYTDDYVTFPNKITFR